MSSSDEGRIRFGFRPAPSATGFDYAGPRDVFSVRWGCGCLLEQERSGRVLQRTPCQEHAALIAVHQLSPAARGSR
jgi:hypothetical protein